MSKKPVWVEDRARESSGRANGKPLYLDCSCYVQDLARSPGSLERKFVREQGPDYTGSGGLLPGFDSPLSEMWDGAGI